MDWLAGCGGAVHRRCQIGTVAGQRDIGQAAQQGFIVLPRHPLEGAHADVAGGHAGQHRAGLGAVIAADAFKGGARALFGIVYAINSHSTDNVLLTRVLECLGQELGLDEETYRAILERITGQTSSAACSDGSNRFVKRKFKLNFITGQRCHIKRLQVCRKQCR